MALSARAQATDVDGLQEERDLRELSDCAAALMRLNAGTYGECQDCGTHIPFQRLLALPTAARCADCQGRRERTGGESLAA